MPRNGSGQYSQPAGTAGVPNTTIQSAPYNTLVADIGNELTNSLPTTGVKAMSANLPMGGNQVVNAADPTTAQALATKNYVDTTKLTNPLTTQGDIIVQGASAPGRLGIGANGTVPMSNGTTLAYVSVRDVNTSNSTYYVGYNMGAATVSVSSPAVVTLASHGLVAGSRVSFSILPRPTIATMSVATPAVVTMTNTFAANQPIVFATTGRLPTGVTPGTTYYVSATGLSGASFQFSATSGGASVNTTAPTVTITIASPGVVTHTAHGRSVGDAVQFATTGALPTGLVAGTTYFVKVVVDANNYQVSATPEGSAITTSGTQSGTQTFVQFGTHYLSQTGALPTGITAGQDYWVIASGLTTNTFQFSATNGGSAINTSGTTTGTINLKTGSDSNTGLGGASAANSFLTLQAAWNALAMQDLSTTTATIQIADGMYLGGLNMNSMPVGGSGLTIQGNTTFPGNVFLNVAGTCIQTNAPLPCGMTIQGIKFAFTASSAAAVSMNSLGSITVSNNELAGGSTGFSGAYAVGATSAKITVSSGHVVSGNMSSLASAGPGSISFFGVPIAIVNFPALSWTGFVASAISFISIPATTFNGYATGPRYSCSQGSIINTNASGATYLPGNSAGSVSSGGQYL